MGIAGFIAALAGSVLSLIISFIPVQFTNDRHVPHDAS